MYHVFILLSVLLSPIIWWYVKLNKNKYLEGIPGPKPNLITGSAHLLGTNTVDLLKSFVKLHKDYGPVFKFWLGSRLHLMVIKPEYVEYFLNSNTHLAKSSGYDLFKPWLGDGLLVSVGAKWRTRRKMITYTFHFKILEQFIDVFNKNMDILVDRLSTTVDKKGSNLEITNFVNLCSLDIICETAFGTSIDAQRTNNNIEYVQALGGYLEMFVSRFFSLWKRNPFLFRFSSEYKTYKNYLETLHNMTNSVIKSRKEALKGKGKQATPQESEDGIKKKSALLDMLLEANESGAKLTDEDIREEVDTFMFEGHDTTTSGISFSLYALAENPEVQEKVYEELVDALGPDPTEFVSYRDLQGLKYLDLVIKECLRMYPSVPLIERRLETDCSLDGFTIPKGTDITIALYCMCHNEEVFPNPDKFDPERFLPERQGDKNNFAYVPFSAGPRNCIGQKFALLEMKLALAKVLRKFKLSVVPGFVPEIGMCSVLKSRNLLQLCLTPRKVK